MYIQFLSLSWTKGDLWLHRITDFQIRCCAFLPLMIQKYCQIVNNQLFVYKNWAVHSVWTCSRNPEEGLRDPQASKDENRARVIYGFGHKQSWQHWNYYWEFFFNFQQLWINHTCSGRGYAIWCRRGKICPVIYQVKCAIPKNFCMQMPAIVIYDFTAVLVMSVWLLFFLKL